MSSTDPGSTQTPSAKRTNAPLWALAGLLFAAVIALALYKALPLLYPTLSEIAAPDPGCDLHAGPCTVRFASGASVRFAIEPQSIPVVTPLRLLVRAEALDAHAVEVDFAGVDMNMGYNRVPLEQTGPGEYAGQGTLPVCVRERMDWEARVLLHTSDGILAAPFRFTTHR